jgi:hypothetical protein
MERLGLVAFFTSPPLYDDLGCIATTLVAWAG